MTHFKTLAQSLVLGTAFVAGIASNAAMAETFTSHHLVDEKPYEAKAERLPGHEKLELREYLDYEQREPCQFYQPIPQGFVRDGCDIRPVTQKPVAMVERKETLRMSNIINDYEVHFAFDSAAVESSAKRTLDTVAYEIERYQPREVTIAGHADKSGPSDYNQQLSAKRAQAISDALTARGVENRVLDEEAYGEMRPAVPTKDGVRLRENRRVVIEFRK